MTEQILLKTSDNNIQTYLPHLKAEIPNFQRSYEWGDEQVLQFLEDLDNEFNNQNSSLYFFGPIITTYDTATGSKQIIDGQQRLTTTTIFLAVVRDMLATFSEKSAESAKHTIINHLIGNGDEYSQFKITQSGDLGQYFRKNIQEFNNDNFSETEISALQKNILSGPSAKGKGNINNLIRAYNNILNYFITKLDDIESNEDKIAHIKNIFNVFIKRFFIVEISSPNRTEAFQIFQTINGRGLNLSAADLIKSDFFGKAGVLENDVELLWNNIQINIGDLKFSDFIRYYWNSKFNFTTARGLYKAVSGEVKTPDQIKFFLQQLYNLTDAFNEINGYPQQTYIPEFESINQLRNILDELNNLGFKIYYPLYLSLVTNDFTPEQLLHIMQKVSSVLIQNKIMGRSTNSFEKIFSSLATYLHKNNISHDDKIDYVFTELSKYEETKETLEFALKNYDFSRDKTMIRYILRFIENITLNEKGYIEDNNKKVHIEHIMPQSPKTFSEWNVTEEEHEEYLWSLGNLTLWLGRNNSALKNADFNTKKNIYKESDVAFTRNLYSIQDWNIENINNRRNTIIDTFLNEIK